jgi:hypothetical protein
MGKVQVGFFDAVRLIRRSLELGKVENAIAICDDMLKAEPKPVADAELRAIGYRNVEIAGDLVTGEKFMDGPVNDWVKFRGSERLMKIDHAWRKGDTGIPSRIWALSDAYGTRGLIPPQGYDWSGIRDSSEVATYAMLGVAEEWWADRGPWPWQRTEVQKP